MSNEEDQNEFSAWDCAGAAGLLGLVPTAIYYVFYEHEIMGTLLLAGFAVGAAGVAFLLAHFLGQRIVSRLLQIIGPVLCIAFWIYAIRMWSQTNKFSDAAPETQEAPASPGQQ